MAREGLDSLFPIEELSIIGLAAVVKELPKILGLIKETAIAVTEAAPDILVIIDSPDFTHRVAKRVRAKAPQLPIVNYVSPTVWAWRPGRARAMLKYVDHVLALLPFEPEAYRKLRGPPCSYVGHPLTEQLASLRPNAEEAAAARGIAAGAAGAAGQPPQRNPSPHGGVRPGGGAAAGAGHGVRTGAADHAASAGSGGRGGEDVAGAAASRDRRAGEARQIPHRARSARQVRHRDARAGVGRRADGDGLPDRQHGGLDPAPRHQGELGDPGQSRDRRECHPRIPAGRLHAGETRRRAARGARRQRAAPQAARGFRQDRRHPIDRQPAAERPRRRYRAGDDVQGAAGRFRRAD